MDAERIYKNLGKRIRDLRKSLPRTQEQLAREIGISRASLANIEAGRQQVLVHHLFALAASLQLDSPALLLVAPQSRAPRSGASSLPLADGGLTDRQRREVLSLMGGALQQTGTNNGEENA